MRITNDQILYTIFRNQWHYAHVTSFNDDPSNIANDRKGICWAGGYYKDHQLRKQSNQFFCVSLFSPDENGRSKRRKAHFSATYVIGLDDVNEKLPPEQVARLPQPTYKMNSSKNSEQWFYVLAKPETSQNRVDNLLEQLIIKGLSPDGCDPGMKGVTRYLRLPDGINNKAKRVAENDGMPYQCIVTDWHPERLFTMEQLAAPFDVDLEANRRNVRTSGSIDIPDHPIVKLLNVKSILSAGRYDITCPWLDNHSDHDDSGSAVFTNEDGTIGFQCHHGHCHEKTANDLLKYLDDHTAGTITNYKSWRNKHQVLLAFKSDTAIATQVPTATVYDFMGEPLIEQKPNTLIDYQAMLNELYKYNNQSKERQHAAETFLFTIEPLPVIEKTDWHDALASLMNWSKPKLKEILRDLRKKWYKESKKGLKFYNDFHFVEPINIFYNHAIKQMYSVQAFQNSFSHIDPDAATNALQGALVEKVHNLDYAPGEGKIFYNGKRKTANLWRDDLSYGVPGDCKRWLDHWDNLGWADFRNLHLQFMASTIRRPQDKINWALLLAGREGIGKDLLLDPMRRSLGDNSNTVEGAMLDNDFNEYLMGYKHIGYNELDLGNHKENKTLGNKLKPIIAAPPDRISINAKGEKLAYIRNIASVTITSNNRTPVYVEDGSRRYHMVWSELKTRDSDNNLLSEWRTYFRDYWRWFNDASPSNPDGEGGWRFCVYHLVHNVSLSTFNFAEAPLVTDFMRGLQYRNKSQLSVDIQDMVDDAIGVFACDIITVKEATVSYNMHYQNGKPMASTIVAKVLGENGAMTDERCSIQGKQKRVVIIRNLKRYQGMNSKQLADEYILQHTALSHKNVISIK